MTEVSKEPDKNKPFFHSDKEQSQISEILDRIDCLQRAIAGVRGQHANFRAEYGDDITEIKRQLYQLRKNKEWVPMGGGIL